MPWAKSCEKIWGHFHMPCNQCLEIAHSLETDSFLMALRRFTARRGQIKEIRCDNSTNFTGGERESLGNLSMRGITAKFMKLYSRGISSAALIPRMAPIMKFGNAAFALSARSFKPLLQTQTVDDKGLATLLWSLIVPTQMETSAVPW